ncbi:MAG: DUF3343 domain-containing protein [bacterium]
MRALAVDTHVAIFHALHRVMAAEQALRAARVRHRLMATPRPLTSSCGLAIAFPGDTLASVESALTSAAPIVELWRSTGERYERVPTLSCRTARAPAAERTP